MDKKYLEELFLYSIESCPKRAVYLFMHDYNLIPKDVTDITFVPKELLESKFNWYLVQTLGIPANYNPRTVWPKFGLWGVNRLRSKDHKTTYYGVSCNHLLNQ